MRHDRNVKILIYNLLHGGNKCWYWEKLKNNIIALSIPVNIFKEVVSAHKDWRAKFQKAIKKFNKKLSLGFQNTACTMNGLEWRSMAGLKSYTRHKHQNSQKLLGLYMLKLTVYDTYVVSSYNQSIYKSF